MVGYIALLRGINVGGRRKILMADLRDLLAQMGFSNIATYIQSGNIYFQSSIIDKEKLENLIEKAIKTNYEFDVPVIIRTTSEINSIIAENPYIGQEGITNDNLHLIFLKSHPKPEYHKLIPSSNFLPDKFEIIGNNIFIYCEGKVSQSKITNTIFEKKLKVITSTRNWKTVIKLQELSK